MVKLDLKDRKLLYYLSLDCRMSNTQLAKKIGLSKNAVKYRIMRLVEEKVITQFATVVHLGAVKLTTFTLLLKFNEDIYEQKELINYFRKHPFADWACTLSGDWDIFAEFVCSDFTHMESIVHGIIEHFKEQLNKYQLYTSHDTLRVEHLIADFYKDLQLEAPISKKRTAAAHDIDSTDRKILALLNEDSSLPYAEIGQHLNLSMDVVRYRIKNMVDKLIIVKFFAEVSLSKLGYTEYLYTLRLKNVSSEKMHKLRNRIQNDSNITYAFVDLNAFNIIFVCAYKAPEGIDHLSRNLRKEYSDIIEQQEYLIIREQILFNLFPRGILDTAVV